MNKIIKFYSKKPLRAMCRAWALIAICFLANFTQGFAQQDSIQTGLRELGQRSVTDYEEQNNSGIENKTLNDLNISAAQLKAVVVAAGVTDFKVFDYTAYSLIGRMKDPEKWNVWAFNTMDSLIKHGKAPKYGYQHYLLIAKEIDPNNGKVKFRVRLRLPTVENPGNKGTNGNRSVGALMTDDELKEIQEGLIFTSNLGANIDSDLTNKDSEVRTIKNCALKIQSLNIVVLGFDEPKPLSLGIAITTQGKVITQEPRSTNEVEYVKFISKNTLYTIAGYAKYITKRSTIYTPEATAKFEQVLDSYLYFTDPLKLIELTGSGLEIEDIDATIKIYRTYDTCYYEHTKIDWKKGSSVLSIIPPTSATWTSSPLYGRSIGCFVKETNYDYCGNNTAGITSAILELQPYIDKTKDKSIYEKILSSSEIDNLAEIINKVCPDALRTLPYITIERLFMQIAMLPEIKDKKEIALLKLMSAINRDNKVDCIANYKNFYALLEASYYNNSPPLLSHLYKELDDRCISFIAWKSNSNLSFIEGLIRMYNEYPDALEHRLAYFKTNDLNEYANKIVIAGLTNAKYLTTGFTPSTAVLTTFREHIFGESNPKSDMLNIRLYQGQTAKTLFFSPQQVDNVYNHKFGYDYYSPLMAVLVDVESIYQDNQLIQEAIQGQLKSGKTFLVPLLFFQYANDAEHLKNRENVIFAAIDVATIASGAGIAASTVSNTRRAWALFEAVGATADIAVRGMGISTDSPYRKGVDIYNGIFGLIGIKNLALAGGTKSINTIQDLVSAIKAQKVANTATTIAEEINSGKNLMVYLKDKLISFKFAYASAKAQRVAASAEKEVVNMAHVVDNMLEPAQVAFFTRLEAYKKLLKALDGLSDELKVKFLDDFGDASDDVLRALNGEAGLVDTWSSLAEADRTIFASNLQWLISIGKQDEALFQIALKDWRFGAAQKNWNEYLSTLSNSSIFGPYDYVSYIKNMAKNNIGKYTLSEANTIFSYTTIFFYREMNQLLRTGVNAAKTERIKNLLNQSLLKMPRVPANTQYFRGVELAGTDLTNFLAKHQEGSIVDYDEFISCANNRADAFIDATASNVKITIETKANSKAHTIWDLSFGKIKKGTTDEALFRTQSKFIVTKNKSLGNDIFEINLKEID